MTGDGHITVTPSEHDSEAQTKGPEESGAHQVLFGFAEARWGWEIEFLCTPLNCCFGGCTPEFGRFRERVAEPPGHLVCQGWGTPCKDCRRVWYSKGESQIHVVKRQRIQTRRRSLEI